MKQKEFLDSLEEELKRINYANIEEVVEYYIELIADKIELGKKEKEVINELGPIDEIIKNIKIDEKLDKASKKPTLSNGLKALIACLSVLSLPFLIPISILIIVIFLTLIILLGSLILVTGSIIISGIAIMFSLSYNLTFNSLSLGTFIFSLGLIIVLIVLATEGMKSLIKLIRKVIPSMVDYLKIKLAKFRKEKENE